MIALLDHRNRNTSEGIRNVFQKSYAVEAEILKAKNFPPLKRPLQDFISSNNDFFGYFEEVELAGVTEIKVCPNYIHIQSLVVAPEFFKRGIGQALIKHVFETYESDVFIVETGLDNTPATNLYKKFGFKEIKQYDTEVGIRKVRFRRQS